MKIPPLQRFFEHSLTLSKVYNKGLLKRQEHQRFFCC